MTTTIAKNIFEPSTSSDPVQKAMDALFAVQQFQQDWKDYGTDRVHRYFDNVDGNWIEEFNAKPLNDEPETPVITLVNIYKQLKNLGIPRSLVKGIGFPEWWYKDLEQDCQAVCKLLEFIGKRFLLNIDFDTDQESMFAHQEIAGLRFKLQKNRANTTLFTRVATSVADDIALLAPSAYRSIPDNALLIRKWILQKSSRVDLDGLLTFCWVHGIPVSNFNILKPKRIVGMLKFDGMVAMRQNRPVIIIGSLRKSEAWQSFILAHELGHIANGHLKSGVLVDDKINGGEIDSEEIEADNFATQLLFGEAILCWDRKLTFKKLYAEAMRLSRIYRVNSGFVVLNYAWRTKDWANAMAVLKKLEPESDAPAKTYDYLNQYRQLQNLDTDSRNYLHRMNVLAA